ncbi:MAG: glycosyltransferase family 9 protein [Acidobacteriota bacterium]|nr:MAG: glycosyltransferase family 9 protein [Acidobacteriota bacterium]
MDFEALHKRITRGARKRFGRAFRGLFAVELIDPIELAAVDLGPAPRILLVRLNYRMGNLLLITPALHALKQRWPRAEVIVCCGDRFADLLRGNNDASEIWPMPRTSPATPLRLARFFRKLRSRPFDIAIDGGRGGSLSGALAVRVARARIKVGGAGTPYSEYFNVRVEPPPAGAHRIEGLLSMLAALGVSTDDKRMRLVLAPDEQQWAAERWREYGLDGRRVIGLNVGARGDKRWPLPRFIELARLVREQGAAVVFFVGPEDEQHLDEAGGVWPQGAIIDRTFEPRRFAALLARCHVVVTGDTGPMHLAAAVGTPVVALFRRWNYEEFRPLGERHRLLFAPQGPPLEQVLEASVALLNESSAPAGGERLSDSTGRS